MKKISFPKPITIGIVGPHYAGKSTLTKRFADELGFSTVQEEWWNDPTKNDKPRDYFRSQMWFLLQTSSSLEKARQLNVSGSSVVLDTFMYSTAVFSETKLDARDMSIFSDWMQFLGTVVTLPDVVIYLHAEPQFLFNVRKEQRVKQGTGPANEAQTPFEWFERICELNQRYFAEWSKTPLLTIDVSKRDILDDTEFDKICNEIKNMVNVVV